MSAAELQLGQRAGCQAGCRGFKMLVALADHEHKLLQRAIRHPTQASALAQRPQKAEPLTAALARLRLAA